MYSENQIRQILHEKQQQLHFYIKIINLYKKESDNIFIELLDRDIILLETILEESSWQKLMRQNKKNKWYRKLFCNHKYKFKERAYIMFKECVKCGKIK